MVLPAKHRRLLAALVIGGGQTCSTDSLVEAVWGRSPPASAQKVLQVYVSRLRRALRDELQIQTDSSGYRLKLGERSLDAARFARLLAEARTSLAEGNATLADSLLGRALSLWRGDAYGELGYEDFARAEAERLEELRQVAIEERIEAGLALRRHEELLAELSGLAPAHPLRERLQGQTMLALYRCGRQAEALELYATTRARLRDEFGLEPSPELRALQRRILQHDRALVPPPREEEPLALLPAAPNVLLGREREIEELRMFLLRGDVRLVVLTGAGGSGKTRLALEAAREIAPSFANGAAFVSLAALRDPELVMGEICRVLGLREKPRARGADPHFNLEEGDADAINAICKRLDGLPLAIELAASHARVLTPGELLAQLDRRLPLLTGGPRDLPARQQTIRATLEWSVDLLKDDEVRDLMHLAVFVGGCTLEAAEAVCGSNVTRLSSLIDHNLLQRTATQHGSRYSMLETIREYAVECLEESGEANERRRQHAEYFCRLAEEAEAELEGAAQAAWLDMVTQEHDNVRAALEWCFGDGEAELGARLASSLHRFWYFRGHVAEGQRWLERAFAASFKPPPALESRMLKATLVLPQHPLDLKRHRELTTRRLTLARERSDAREVAACLNNLGLIAAAEGDSHQAEKLFRESVSKYGALEQSASRIGIDVPLGNLSRIAFIVNDLESAYAFAQESMAIARARGDPEQIFDMTGIASLIRIQQNRLRDAVELCREAAELAEQLDSIAIFYESCTLLAILLARQGRHERAAQVLGKRRALRDELGQPHEWFDHRVLPDAEERVRRGLSEESILEAMNVGAFADVHQLLDSALRDAELAAFAAGMSSEQSSSREGSPRAKRPPHPPAA